MVQCITIMLTRGDQLDNDNNHHGDGEAMYNFTAYKKHIGMSAVTYIWWGIISSVCMSKCWKRVGAYCCQRDRNLQLLKPKEDEEVGEAWVLRKGRALVGFRAGLANRKTRRPQFFLASASASINVANFYTWQQLSQLLWTGHRPFQCRCNNALIKILIDVISGCWNFLFLTRPDQNVLGILQNQYSMRIYHLSRWINGVTIYGNENFTFLSSSNNYHTWSNLTIWWSLIKLALAHKTQIGKDLKSLNKILFDWGANGTICVRMKLDLEI